MAITRSVIEARLKRSNSLLLEMIDASTDPGDTPLIGDAIEEALLLMGYTVATIGSVDDADLATVPDDQVPYLLAQTSYCLHTAMLPNVIAIVSEMVTSDQVMYSDMARRLETRIAAEGKEIEVKYVNGQSGTYGGKMAPNPVIPDSALETYL